MDPVLVEVTRAGRVESRHAVAISVVDETGKPVFSAGDVAAPYYPRSAIKAFLALPLVESGGADALGLGDDALALIAASHAGEPAHVDGVRAILGRAGVDEDALACGAHWPLSRPAATALACAGEKPGAVHNNCSGKHAGLACLCRTLGVKLAGYERHDHAAMRAATEPLETLTGSRCDDANRATDGCSIPTYAIPLASLAAGFARFGTGTGMGDARAAAARRLRDAVARHPAMVAGTGRFDTVLMEAFGDRLFVKGGAEGIWCACLPELGLGIAVKALDGAGRAAQATVAAILARHLGETGPLATEAAPILRNWNGIEVGALRVVLPQAATAATADTAGTPDAEPPPGDAAIGHASGLLGVAYTQAERDLMRDGLVRQRDRARRRRGVAFADDLLPASGFDPRPPGFVPPAPAAPAGADRPDPGPLPSDEDAVADAPSWRQAGWLAAGALGARRLAALYLARIERRDGAILSFARTVADAALAHADRLDAALAATGRPVGPLHGLPYGMKDIVDTAGIVTDWGAEPYRGRLPTADAHVTSLLAEAGAILLGKTSVGALAYGDIWYGGRTRNPWNLEQGSSGSSAGSAAAVAAGFASFAIGTETYGSIVSPAARCRVLGLRPTFGLVSRRGVMSLCPSLDKVGVLARDADDAALVLGVLEGADPGDPAQIARPPSGPFRAEPRAARGLRLGYRDEDLAPEARDLLDGPDGLGDTLARDAGITLHRLAQRPALPYDALLSILDAEAAASFEALTASDRDDLLAWQDEPAWPNGFRRARFLSAVDHVQADRLRRLVMQAVDADWRAVDAVLASAGTGDHLLIGNFTGIPALAVPGFGEDGLLSLVLAAPPFHEARLLALGAALENARGHREHARASGVWQAS